MVIQPRRLWSGVRPPGPRARSLPRTGLTREKIIDAALDFVDEHGLAAGGGADRGRITVLREDGVPLADALAILNPVVMWTLGHTLSEVGETPHHEGTEPRPEQLSALDRTTCPHLARAFGTGEGLDSERRFHRTLRILLAGYAAESDVTEGAGNRPANAPG